MFFAALARCRLTWQHIRATVRFYHRAGGRSRPNIPRKNLWRRMSKIKVVNLRERNLDVLWDYEVIHFGCSSQTCWTVSLLVFLLLFYITKLTWRDIAGGRDVDTWFVSSLCKTLYGEMLKSNCFYGKITQGSWLITPANICRSWTREVGVLARL